MGPRWGAGPGSPSRHRAVTWAWASSVAGTWQPRWVYIDPCGGKRGREDAHFGGAALAHGASCALGPAAGDGHLSGHGAALPTPRPQLFYEPRALLQADSIHMADSLGALLGGFSQLQP